MVPKRRLELPRSCDHWHLKPARLPIPPPGQGACFEALSLPSPGLEVNRLRAFEQGNSMKSGDEILTQIWFEKSLSMMEITMTACCEDIDFPEHFSDLEDPRQAGKVLYLFHFFQTAWWINRPTFWIFQFIKWSDKPIANDDFIKYIIACTAPGF